MTDFFEFPNLQPDKVQQVLEKIIGDKTELSYSECDLLIDELNKIGWTCEYGLDSSPYNLHPLNQ
jgi:hypothetical protein